MEEVGHGVKVYAGAQACAVRLIKDRGISYVQDLNVRTSQLPIG